MITRFDRSHFMSGEAYKFFRMYGPPVRALQESQLPLPRGEDCPDRLASNLTWSRWICQRCSSSPTLMRAVFS